MERGTLALHVRRATSSKEEWGVRLIRQSRESGVTPPKQ